VKVLCARSTLPPDYSAFDMIVDEAHRPRRLIDGDIAFPCGVVRLNRLELRACRKKGAQQAGA
ncbi:MAG TPA: hypothetical protein VKE26_10320, partial [Xanthobacteraceae bacterium]|nr:hypothetical protein [Xanthobacteraceae bacterium]